MKTKSNNNPSKLQSEAVLEFDELWVILTNRKLVSEKPHTKADIKQFLSDQFAILILLYSLYKKHIQRVEKKC